MLNANGGCFQLILTRLIDSSRASAEPKFTATTRLFYWQQMRRAMKLFYLIGAPGSGKTTLLAAMTRQWLIDETAAQPIYHIIYRERDCIQLGRERPMFGGTDTLALNVQPKALIWLKTRPFEYVMGEGARLSSGSFLSQIEPFCEALYVVYLNTPSHICSERIAQRGHEFKPSFVKGAATRALRVAQQFIRTPRWYLDGSQSVAALSDVLSEHPFFVEMRINGVKL
jgi:ribose 1,5-bisphosphokinase PhnN